MFVMKNTSWKVCYVHWNTETKTDKRLKLYTLTKKGFNLEIFSPKLNSGIMPYSCNFRVYKSEILNRDN